MPEPSSDPRRIVAVVVTFNRRDMVTRLVAALDARKRACRTRSSWSTTPPPTAPRTPSRRRARPRRSTVLRLTENTGGAGGFHAGLGRGHGARRRPGLADGRRRDPRRRTACRPCSPHAGHATTSSGPAVVAEDDPGRLCFPIRVPGSSRVVHAVADVEARRPPTGLLEGVVIPFNGVLVTRELVERIGLPREEFFIWGDDVEYLWRARRGGRPHRHGRRRPLPAPVDRRPRHAADVRPDDVQPLALGPEALLHVPQQRGQPARPPRARSACWRSW